MKKILIIEDTDILREQISYTLKMEGYDVKTACDGTQGIEFAKSYQPDLILCDIVMPGISGYDVLKALKPAGNQSIYPFIFITALSERKNFREGMELGAHDYLIKPFTIDELKNAITTQLRKADSLEAFINQQINQLENNFNIRLSELKTEVEQQQNLITDITTSRDSALEELNQKQAQLMHEALRTIEANTTLQEIAKQLAENLKKKDLTAEYRETLVSLKNNIRKKSALINNWTIFQLKFDLTYPDINAILFNRFPDLTQQERLLISGIYTKLNTNQIAVILNIQAASVRKYKFRLKHKLGLNKDDDLYAFISNLGKSNNSK